MTTGVSSWFRSQAEAPMAEPRRFFTIGASDYAPLVLQWPRLAFRSDALFLGTVAMRLSNPGGALNFFVECGVSLTTSCEIAVGFQRPGGGDERLSLFQGQPAAVTLEDWGTTARLHLQGKTGRLTDAKLGSDVESQGLDFTGSPVYPADLAWTLVTCYGGMSPLASPANPDLDFEKWQAWRERDVIQAVGVEAYFTGQKVFQALETLAEMGSMVVSFRGGKLDFSPRVADFSQPVRSFTLADVIGFSVSMEPDRVVNDFSVECEYDPPTRTFRGRATRSHAPSQALYGRKSGRLGPRGVWFATGADGNFLAEDRVRFGYEPHPRVSLRTPLAGGIHLALGDAVTLEDSVFPPLAGAPLRIDAMAFDLAEGTLDFQLEPALQRPWQFQTTVSTRNLLLPALAKLETGPWLGIEETAATGRILRQEPDGGFEPLSAYATALLPLRGQQVLFGGPPDSGAPHSVLRRSADGGSTAVTVSSLTPLLPAVHDIWEVASGTCLASTSSGGIWRSTDAGSSWAHTFTISGGYHVARFFEPASGRVWGGTGVENPVFASGAHIWESTDGGASWVPRGSPVASGTVHVQGFFAAQDGEILLSTQGALAADLKVHRSRTTAPDSVAWTVVLSGAGFSEIVRTESNHLLFGFNERQTSRGGGTYRSLDAGSSWRLDASISKQGNVRIFDPGDGTLEAFSARISAGFRTDRYRNFDPNRVG